MEELMGCRRLTGGNHRYNRAMMTNSLFLYYLESIGLKTSKDGSTRDIISIDFSMGTNTYEDSRKRVEAIIRKEESEEKIEGLNQIIEYMDEHKDNFKKISKESIRKQWYKDGLTLTYTTQKRDRVVQDTIHYKYLYRSVGQAKVGSAIFIREELFDKARKFMYMGVELPDSGAKIVEMGAYSSLIASSVINTIKINPRNVLVLSDTDSFFETNVVSVELNDEGHCVVVPKENYKLKNTINDGMALLDKSLFPSWGLGYILLRNHMTKCAAFKTDIQKFFKDHYGDKYDEAIVVDLWGNEHFAKDIQMITTTEAMKWLKFNITYDEFCEKVNEIDNTWGVVKTAHPSKHLDGKVQRMSYQMVNCLDMETLSNVTKFSEDYIWQLKSDDKVFLQFLKDNTNYANDYDVLLALVKHCGDDFLRCDYFQTRRNKIIEGFVAKFKSGKVYIENADNLVMCGNPYALLLKAVGENPLSDNTFSQRDDCIECYAPRFDDGEFLAGFRSPHNGINNILALKNTYHPFFDRYFDISNQCIMVNCIGTDIQDRANGCDFDSDMIFCTNQEDIVNRALYAYKNYPTIVNNVPMEISSYGNTPQDYAKADIKIASGNRVIGESSNLAQLALSYSYTFDTEQKYKDLVCILSVLAQLAIDSAKKRVVIDLAKETKYLKDQLGIKDIGVPVFWKNLKDNVREKSVNYELECPMNELGAIKLRETKHWDIIPIREFFIQHELKQDRRTSKKVEKLIEDYASVLMINRVVDDNENNLLLMSDFEQLVERLRTTYISKGYAGIISWLLNRAFMITPQMKGKASVLSYRTIDKNKSILLKTLYETSPQSFLSCFSKIC